MKITDEVRISDNGFVFNSKTGDSFNLNPTGLELIKLIAEGKDFNAIRDIFLARYDMEELRFEKDFYEFCALIKHHQITTVENPLDFK
ncbi:MAG: PqqD family protein [Bacteroidales bacterium]|nr:PqqD family protein [Bacteroidales bacterium]MCB9012455.1 PqqD family protein [Bacteroidales bacterium]